MAALPAGTVGHFGPELRRFVLAQYHPGQVTVPRIVAHLRDLGMAISKRQVVRLLIAGKEAFLAEAAGVLKSGLESAAWITVDDTGARYKGMNGACTHIGNTDFAWFATHPREEPAELPGAFAGWRHRLRDQRRGAGLHARPEPLGAGDRPARWAQKQAPQRPGGVDGPSRAPRHHPAPGASRSAEDRHRWRAMVEELAPSLLELEGVGTENAGAVMVAVGDNPDRLRSEASFAMMCGVCPIPASSGKTQRHRLNRGGNRQANSALHMVVVCRMRTDERTRVYVARRTLEGLSKREIMRCLKRYVAREIYRVLTAPSSA